VFVTTLLGVEAVAAFSSSAADDTATGFKISTGSFTGVGINDDGTEGGFVVSLLNGVNGTRRNIKLIVSCDYNFMRARARREREQ
jgi:hypothetical protein